MLLQKKVTDLQKKCKEIFEDKDIWNALIEIASVHSLFGEATNEFEANKAYFKKRGIEDCLIFIQSNAAAVIQEETGEKVRLKNISVSSDKNIINKIEELTKLEQKMKKYNWLLKLLP